MLGQIPTAPFGAARLSLATISVQGIVQACPPGKPVHKWKVFRHICEARSRLGVSDRALAILDALLSFHPDTVLVSGAADLVVFPSNQQLALRAHGIASSTLRRHLAALVEAGLLLRRDSPNGKRYARRGANGDIEQAFGLDLGPIVARANELAELAGSIAKERKILGCLREQATLARRDIAKMIVAGVEEGVDADWSRIHREFRDLVSRLPRIPSRDVLEPLVEKLTELSASVLAILQQHAERCEARTGDVDSSQGEDCVETEPETSPLLQTICRCDQKTQSTAIPIGLIVEACPDFLDYARGDIRTVQDLIATARLVRPLLGVSPSAWEDACAVMGEEQASAVLAAILQRGTAIKNAGGYLRALTRRASAGEFSIWPMLMALTASRRRREAESARTYPCPSFPDEQSSRDQPA